MLLFYSRSTFNLDPPLYTTIDCTVLNTENGMVQFIVVYKGGFRLNGSVINEEPWVLPIVSILSRKEDSE